MVNSIIVDILNTLISNSFTNKKIETRLMPTLNSIINTTLVPKIENGEQKDLSTLITVSFYKFLVF
jgi:hypothetical protein